MTDLAFPPKRELPKGVKQTTGGSFDPNASQTYFIAGDPATLESAEYKHVLVAVNELKSNAARDQLQRLLDTGHTVMLDSGIFNLAMEHVRKHGTSHDVALSMAPEEIDGFDRLWDQYGEIVTTFGDQLWGAVELDQGGAENKPRTRARIEKEFGIVPIPVYHPLLDGWDYYDDLAREYDRICFGNVVQAHSALRIRLAHTAMERARQYPYLWTHLLGLSQSSAVLGIRWRGSMDSSSWLSPVRWPVQWPGFGMGTSYGSYGPEMWPHKASYFEGPETFDGLRARMIAAGVAHSQQQVFDSVLEDTHADYSGRDA